MVVYAGYGAWLLIGPANGPVLVGPEIGLEVDEDATGLRSGSPSSFWIYSSSISPCLGELKLFLLERGSLGSRPDRSSSDPQLRRDGLRAGTKEGDCVLRWNNQHKRAKQLQIRYLTMNLQY